MHTIRYKHLSYRHCSIKVDTPRTTPVGLATAVYWSPLEAKLLPLSVSDGPPRAHAGFISERAQYAWLWGFIISADAYEFYDGRLALAHISRAWGFRKRMSQFATIYDTSIYTRSRDRIHEKAALHWLKSQSLQLSIAPFLARERFVFFYHLLLRITQDSMAAAFLDGTAAAACLPCKMGAISIYWLLVIQCRAAEATFWFLIRPIYDIDVFTRTLLAGRV